MSWLFGVGAGCAALGSVAEPTLYRCPQDQRMFTSALKRVPLRASARTMRRFSDRRLPGGFVAVVSCQL